MLPDKHSWRTAKALWDIVSRWGKSHWLTTDNGKEFDGQFEALTRTLAVKHRPITVGYSQVNGQAERMIRTSKDAICRMLTQLPSTYRLDHVPAALMMLRFTPQRTLGLPPFYVATGQVAMPPSHLVESGALGDSQGEEELDFLEGRF